MARSTYAFAAAALSFAAFALMLVSTLSVPIINSVYLIHVEAHHVNTTVGSASLDLGIMGICGSGGDILTVAPKPDGTNNCYGFGPGYSVFMPTPGSSNYIGNEHSSVLFVVPAATCFSGLMAVFAIIAASLKRGSGITTSILLGLVALLNWSAMGLTAYVVDSAQSQIARRTSVELGISTSSKLGATMFLVLAAAICTTVALGLSIKHTLNIRRSARFELMLADYPRPVPTASNSDDVDVSKKLARMASADSALSVATPPQYDFTDDQGVKHKGFKNYKV